MYLTAADLSDPPDEGFLSRHLTGVPVERALEWCARMLAPSAGPDWRSHQEAQARLWFEGVPASAHALHLVLDGEREMFAPQILLHLARLALLHACPLPPPCDEPAAKLNEYETTMRTAMLVLAHHSGSNRRLADNLRRRPGGMLVLDGSSITGLEGELAANLIVNQKPYAPSVFDRSERRWIEIPQEEKDEKGTVDLVSEFAAATGVPFGDLRMIGLMVWAAVLGQGTPRMAANYLDDLGLGRERTERALDLISGTPADLAAEARAAGGAGLGSSYDLSVFGRRPLVRLSDGGLLVVSPQLLVDRTLGWLPRWDLDKGLQRLGGDGRKRAKRAVGYLRTTTERHAVETARNLASAGAQPAVLYGEMEIQKAYGTADRNADCAIDWLGAWVVVEISSRTVTQETAGASGEALIKDISLGVVEKAKQLDRTIQALRADESALTGQPADGPRRFWPVLVTTEGFPIHPVITARVRTMIRDAGYLQDADTAPVDIDDGEALEAAEALVARGGPALPVLLAQHAASAMRTYGFREWLITQRGSRRPPDRVMQRWTRVLAPVEAALRRAETEPPHDTDSAA